MMSLPFLCLSFFSLSLITARFSRQSTTQTWQIADTLQSDLRRPRRKRSQRSRHRALRPSQKQSRGSHEGSSTHMPFLIVMYSMILWKEKGNHKRNDCPGMA